MLRKSQFESPPKTLRAILRMLVSIGALARLEAKHWPKLDSSTMASLPGESDF